MWYCKVFVRGKMYKFGPYEINELFHRSSLEEVFEPSLDQFATLLTRNKVLSWPKNDLSSKVRHMVSFDLGEVIFHHIVGFVTMKKEPKVYLPFASMIFALLSAQGFTPYDYEKLLDPLPKYTVDLWLTQGDHANDRVSLAAIPAPVTFSSPGSAPSGSSSVPPPVVSTDSSIFHALRVCILNSQACFSQVKTCISSLQIATSNMEKTLLNDMRKLTRLELIQTSCLADLETFVDASDDFASPTDC